MAYKLQTLRSGATQLPEEMIDFLTVKMIGASGVFDYDNNDFDVQQNPAPSMGVTIKMGAAWIRKSDGSMVYPVNLETQDATLAIGANSSGNPRIDAVVLYIDLAAASDATCTNVAKLVVVAGAPSATPQAPSDASISAAIGAANPFLRLANVTVANGAATIVDANIADTRVNITLADSFNQDFEVGDMKSTFKATLRGRWLKADAKTIGNAASTADYKGEKYKALFDHITTVLGYVPTAAWAANGKVVLPDAVNRVLMGAGSSYGLGTTGGTDTHDHTTAGVTLADHTHNDDHNHWAAGQSNGYGMDGTIRKGSGDPIDLITVNNHSHYVSIGTNYKSAGGFGATTGGQNGSRYHEHGNTGVANHVPKYIAVNHFIKY